MTALLMTVTAMTVGGFVVILFLTLPFLYKAPISQEKRRYVSVILALSLVLVVAYALSFRTWEFSLFLPFLFAFISMGTQLFLLKKLDYYIEDVLHELMTVTVLSTSIVVQQLYWNFAIDQLYSGILIRLGVVALSLLTLSLLGVLASAKYYRYTVLVFLILLAIRWFTFPYWGVWYMIMALLYSVLVGYVAFWQFSTTKAQQVYSENQNSTILWIILIVIASVLVLAF